MKRSTALVAGLVLACVFVLAGCAASTSPALQDKVQGSTYRIGPGDSLQIYVRNNPDLSIQVPVRPDGKISMPLVQSITAADKTPNELAEELQDRLGAYVREPTVTVIVTGFQGTYADQIRVVGEAAQPQAMPYRQGMTLLDVMINVGGLTQYAAGNRAKLVRQENGTSHTYDIQLADLLDGDIDDNLPMHPGDVLIIPRTYF